jgi:hypothetical protein
MASSCPTASAQLDRRLLCPDSGKISLADYARAWIDERPGLRPKTVELYRYLLRRHLAPILGAMPIADIQPAHVRRSYVRQSGVRPAR